MKDIQFRVYDKDRNTMVYDVNITFTTWGTVLAEYDTGEEEGVPIKNSKLMQYTGLKDEDGVKIYEGDIVECVPCFDKSIVSVVQVEFDEGVFGVRWREHLTGNSMLKLTLVKTKVIGNIYDNPELLLTNEQ